MPGSVVYDVASATLSDLSANGTAGATCLANNLAGPSTVDGRPAPVVRADAAFLGVRLPAGSHRVRLEYHPRGVKEGLGIAAAGILGLALAGLRLGAAAP